MGEVFQQMNEQNSILQTAWKKSRHGAWAGGGFHYQHLISTLILVRQWAGLSPSGDLVPEGLEDCVIELPQQQVWIQVKSRNDGVFSEAEVDKIFSIIDVKTATLGSGSSTNSVVVINQDFSGASSENFDQLFDEIPRQVILCSSPEDEIVNLLIKFLNTAVIIAEGIASDLYKLVATISRDNSSASYEERRRISTTEVERRIFERLEAEDPSAIDQALVSGSLEPIDFRTPVYESSFYLGVKSKPGHVAAGLILSRSDEVKEVANKLKNHRHVLIAGPSGMGKSALMWLSASSLASEFRWFQVGAQATVNEVDSIVRFVRARRPTCISPIGIAVDEVNPNNNGLWDMLLQALRSLPDVYVLGSVRTEDVYLIANQSDTEFIHVSLDERLAENIWKKLSKDNYTTWPHWREPFEQSEGLMLEYVHILTQGSRLAAVISEQIRLREYENRTDELSILRCTTEICRHGGEVDAGHLFKFLDIPPERSSIAFKRLLDEHLVHESRPGILGGLHTLRSKALSDATHDELIYLRTDSLWNGILSVTNETLPRVVQSILNELEANGDEKTILKKIAELLASSNDIGRWTSILTGLGLATLERHVSSYISILEQHNIQRAHWSLASMFFDPSTNVPDMPELEQWQVLKEAVEEFRIRKGLDLRNACLEFLPKGTTVPKCKTFQEANRLFSSAVPIAGGDPVQINITPEFKEEGEQNIEEVATFLSTAFLINHNMAVEFVNAFGGEEVLFGWFHKQTPWVSVPTIELNGKHGRTVRADWHLVAEEFQSDPHDTVVDICEKLIAISPESNGVASDAVDPTGRLIKVGEIAIVTKNIPRENLPSKSRVAWNATFRQILLARAAGDSLTNYTRQMGRLSAETEKLFRSYSEKWISGKKIGNTNTLATGINKVCEEVNSLVYAEPQPVTTHMTAVDKGAALDDGLGSLLIGILGNLVPRMNKLPNDSSTKGVATFAGSLAAQARDHLRSNIWRTTSAPPLKKLRALAERLEDLSFILHEMAYDDSPSSLKALVKVAKRASQSKSVHFAAKRCRIQADQRLHNKLRDLEKALKERGCYVKCWTRPVDEFDSVYWPPVEIAVLVEVTDFETDISYLMESLSTGKEVFGQEWPFRVAPIIDGIVLPSFALQLTSGIIFSEGTTLPDTDFAKHWIAHIEHPFQSSNVSDAYDKAISACMQLSGIVNYSNLKEMNPIEEEVTDKIVEGFKINHKYLQEAAIEFNIEELDWAVDKVETTWNKLIGEFEAAKDGKTISSPLYEGIYAVFSEQQSEWLSEIAATRILLRQAEIYTATG